MKTSTSRCNVLLVLSALLATACASTGTLVNQPTVVLTSLAAREVSFRSQTFLLEFRVSNPNPFPLPVESVRYRILFDDQKFAGGESTAGFSIPANGDGAFSISVETDVLGSAAQITSLLSSGIPKHVEYELQGSLVVDIPLVKPLAFSNAGVIPIE
jgi:LEA14-like dessication related protein